MFSSENTALPVVRTLSDVEPERVSWLWPGYLPAGKLVVIDGDPSCGKSTLTIDLAARCSTGSPWPDGAASSGPADVLLLSAEDGLGDTIAPRLHAAGADLTRVHALLEVPQVNDDEIRMVPPSLPRDIPILRDLVVRHQVKLVVIDVLMAYLNGKVDSHRDQDVRGVLHQLAAMADATGCTLVLIRHLNKAGGGSPLYRGGGSIGIIGAARAAYIVGRDPDDQDRRVFAVTKLNIAIEPPALAYRLISDDTYGCARVDWETEPVTGMTAAHLLRNPDDAEERGERDQAAAWLADYLTEQGGEASANDVFREAAQAGWSRDQIKRAKTAAGASSVKSGLRAGWVWRVDPADEGSEESGLSRCAPFHPFGAPFAALHCLRPAAARCGARRRFHHLPDLRGKDTRSMTDPTRPVVEHNPRCQRRSAPIQRLSWKQQPELWCPDCGATSQPEEHPGGAGHPAKTAAPRTDPAVTWKSASTSLRVWRWCLMRYEPGLRLLAVAEGRRALESGEVASVTAASRLVAARLGLTPVTVREWFKVERLVAQCPSVCRCGRRLPPLRSAGRARLWCSETCRVRHARLARSEGAKDA